MSTRSANTWGDSFFQRLLPCGQAHADSPLDDRRRAEATKRLRAHWDSFYTENDFHTIKSYGLNHVRIPIGQSAYSLLVFGSLNSLSRSDSRLQVTGLSIYLMESPTFRDSIRYKNAAFLVFIALPTDPSTSPTAFCSSIPRFPSSTLKKVSSGLDEPA